MRPGSVQTSCAPGASGPRVCATGDDSRILHAAVLAKLHGIGLTLTILDDPAAAAAFDAAGVDAAIDPGDETAGQMVRFTLGGDTADRDGKLLFPAGRPAAE